MSGDALTLARFRRPEAETCEHIGPQGVYWSKGPVLLHSDTLEGPVRKVARLPRPLLRRVLATTRLGRRLARETFYNVIPLADGGLFWSYGTEVGFISAGGEITSLEGRARSHRVLRGGAAVMPDGSVVFGEYFDNADREAVRVYRATPGDRSVEEVYSFAPGAVRHIHCVRWDPCTARAIVCTGDLEPECRMVAFTPDFSESQVLGEGTEDWRTISPQFSDRAIYFGTDAQYATNRLLRYDRAAGTLTHLADVNGPVFYSAALTGGWIFATSVEMCPSQTSPEAILYFIDAETEAVRIVGRYPKDRLPTRYFQFGILNFPITDSPQLRVPVSGVALEGLDGRFVLVGTQGH